MWLRLGSKFFLRLPRTSFRMVQADKASSGGHPLHAFRNDRWVFKTGFTITQNGLLGICHANAR